MLEIIFLTTNASKLANLARIGRSLGVKVTGFRQKTYLKSYSEPDSEDRELVLEQSFESALAQVARAELPDDAIFFLEDTSVRIDALSTGAREFPGTRIKFWMRENSFDDLNALLGGSVRTATVRSDIVVHLPRAVREYFRLDKPYFSFVGEVDGTVAQSPSEMQAPNILYPWLDPKSFSGWFKPSGVNEVLAELPIAIADEFDFRRRAFIALLELLRRLHIYPTSDSPSSIQHDLPFLQQRRVVVLVGQSCSGKTTGARFLSDTGAYVHLEASDFMRAELVRRHGARKGVSVREFAEAALREEPSIVAEQVARIVQEAGRTNFVLSGLRSPDELVWLRRLLPGVNIDVRWIDASRKTRFTRAKARKRDAIANDYSTFREDDELQIDMGLGRFRKVLKDSVVTNEASIIDFESALRASLEITSQPGGAEAGMGSDVLSPLQRRIIIALGALGGEREYFTSGQLAAFTSDPVNGLTRTAKDNISRFFTQASYPYFELKRLKGGTEVKLSNTGASMFRALAAGRGTDKDSSG